MIKSSYIPFELHLHFQTIPHGRHSPQYVTWYTYLLLICNQYSLISFLYYLLTYTIILHTADPYRDGDHGLHQLY